MGAAMTATAHSSFGVREWKPFERNTLRGFLSIELPSGLILHGCTLHEKTGSRWVGLPAREYQKDGERIWSPLIEFSTREVRQAFQEQALAAFDAYMGEVDK
jgi:hypothetical protein